MIDQIPSYFSANLHFLIDCFAVHELFINQSNRMKIMSLMRMGAISQWFNSTPSNHPSLEILIPLQLYNIIMKTVSTNKGAMSSHQIHKHSQHDLHVKILNLIAKRADPTNPRLEFDKHSCGSCVSAISPTAETTKKNSLAATRAREVSKANLTMYEERQSFKKTKQFDKSNSEVKIGTSSFRQRLHKRQKQLFLQSKVFSLSIDHSKLADFTIDLRNQMPTEFVNVRLLNKLKLQNIEKEKRIKQLQGQVIELNQRIIELSLNVDVTNPNSFKYQICPPQRMASLLNQMCPQNNSPKQGFSSNKESCVKSKPSEKQTISQDLIRMLRIQARQLQRCKKNANGIFSVEDQSYQIQ